MDKNQYVIIMAKMVILRQDALRLQAIRKTRARKGRNIIKETVEDSPELTIHMLLKIIKKRKK